MKKLVEKVQPLSFKAWFTCRAGTNQFSVERVSVIGSFNFLKRVGSVLKREFFLNRSYRNNPEISLLRFGKPMSRFGTDLEPKVYMSSWNYPIQF
jgi:hypothetical protein